MSSHVCTVTLYPLSLTLPYTLSKVMCSSVRDAFNSECGGGKNPRCGEARKNKALDRLDLSTLTRVVILRDPFERVLSAYFNANTNRYIKIPGHCESARLCSLEIWVAHLARLSSPKKQLGNEHFKQQTEVAQFDKMHYDYKLRLSSKIDQDFFWDELVKMEAVVKNTKKNHDKNYTKTNTTTSVGNQTATAPDVYSKVQGKFRGITNKTIVQIAAIYRDDFRMWEEILQWGTPRQEGGYTMYDYYKDHLESGLKESLARALINRTHFGL
jgi:hypothetical protein